LIKKKKSATDVFSSWEIECSFFCGKHLTGTEYVKQIHLKVKLYGPEKTDIH